MGRVGRLNSLFYNLTYFPSFVPKLPVKKIVLKDAFVHYCVLTVKRRRGLCP